MPRKKPDPELGRFEAVSEIAAMIYSSLDPTDHFLSSRADLERAAERAFDMADALVTVAERRKPKPPMTLHTRSKA